MKLGRIRPADGLLAIVADITSRERVEVERAAQVEYLQQLADQLPAFLWLMDRDLIVRQWSQGLRRATVFSDLHECPSSC